MKFELLSSLWLHEPDAALIARAAELGLPAAEPLELAAAYADVFLLNVPPYGTVFSDDSGEMNGPAAQDTAALFAAHGYQPPELSEVGAADHVGLMLGFLEEGRIGELEIGWMPVCCLAIKREPTAGKFYKALAFKTQEAIFKLQTPNFKFQINSPIFQFSNSQSELSLRDLIRFFLTPAYCGLFLSRARLGQMALALGLRLPFGSRWEVAEWLFESAGEAGKVNELIGELENEVQAWAAEYRRWAENYPAWRPMAETWLARTSAAQRQLTTMRLTVQADLPEGDCHL
ncbi:MAG: molecular chaperone TorD family protein [Chloroflexi bacterium]|nr:molecular chaperone TorD family protein [Chloroflexota bacterium]